MWLVLAVVSVVCIIAVIAYNYRNEHGPAEYLKPGRYHDETGVPYSSILAGRAKESSIGGEEATDQPSRVPGGRDSGRTLPTLPPGPPYPTQIYVAAEQPARSEHSGKVISSAQLQPTPLNNPDLASNRVEKTSESLTELSLRRASKIAERLSNEALEDIRDISEVQRLDWYGNLQFQHIYEIARGNLDPLKTNYIEHYIPPFATTFSGRAGDFFHLGLTLHHFTSAENVNSIQEYGLLSYREALDHAIFPNLVSSPSSRATDARLGLDRYVNLSFTNRSAMAYSVESRFAGSLADFRVSPAVLEKETTLYCRGYANKRGASWIKFDQMTALDLIALFLGFDRMKYWQLMVLDRIPPTHIRLDPTNTRRTREAVWL